MDLVSQIMRKRSPELDPLRIGTGWKPEDLSKPQVFIESTFGDSHPGSGHLTRGTLRLFSDHAVSPMRGAWLDYTE